MQLNRLIAGLLFVGATTARADIYQWRWVDPQNPSLGKVQSNVLCPDGAGVVATAYSYWPYLDLSQAYLKEAELPNSLLYNSVLTAGYFENANLAGSVIWGCEISNADFTSTSATHANFRFSTLNGASFAEADLSGATFLVGSMTGVSFQRANLTDAFFNTDLTGVDFTDAVVAGADFRRQVGSAGSGFTSGQLYSTASYKNRDLRRVRLGFNDLSGWDFSGMDLTDASFMYSHLAGGRFANANLTDARIDRTLVSGGDFRAATMVNADLEFALLHDTDFTGANLKGANLFRADLRGAKGAELSDVKTIESAILPDGRVEYVFTGLMLEVRNYHGEGTIPIRVEGTHPEGVVSLGFDNEQWRSPITFSEEEVSLAGLSLGLGFASAFDPFFDSGIDPSRLIGQPIRIFDWAGVSVLHEFQNVWTAPYEWDTSRLYADGTVILLPEPNIFGIFYIFIIVILLHRIGAKR